MSTRPRLDGRGSRGAPRAQEQPERSQHVAFPAPPGAARRRSHLALGVRRRTELSRAILAQLLELLVTQHWPSSSPRLDST